MLSALGLCARIQEAVRDSSHLCGCASQGHCSIGVATVDSDHWRAPIWGLNVGTVSVAMLDGGHCWIQCFYRVRTFDRWHVGQARKARVRFRD